MELDETRLQIIYMQAIDQSLDGVLLLDSTGRIYRVNDTFCRMIGYSRDELLGLTVADMDLTGTADRVSRIFHETYAQEKFTFESTLKRRDDTVFPVEITNNYTELDGRKFSCTVIRDITERKEAGEALESALMEVKALKDRLQDENLYLQEEIKVAHNFNDIIGNSNVYRSMLGQIEQVAATEASVLILGESGTGKELVARAVHQLSLRSERPLVKVNCAALPANLIESELFGHEKGAFTGALTRKTGRFELADNGTIFLDEIGELPLELQSKLLRVLQEGEFERLGNPNTLQVDVRVIAATNRDLETQVENGAFREDLYYRLNVFPIHCPSLRERKEDIPLLVRHFIDKYSGRTGKQINAVPKKVMEAFTAYSWPGNVRELENIVERALIVSRGTALEIGPWLKREPPEPEGAEVLTLEENERRHILEVLGKTAWRVSGDRGAARILGINAQTLVSRMKKLGIKRPT